METKAKRGWGRQPKLEKRNHGRQNEKEQEAGGTVDYSRKGKKKEAHEKAKGTQRKKGGERG